jgi:hypothetical protein
MQVEAKSASVGKRKQRIHCPERTNHSITEPHTAATIPANETTATGKAVGEHMSWQALSNFITGSRHTKAFVLCVSKLQTAACVWKAGDDKPMSSCYCMSLHMTRGLHCLRAPMPFSKPDLTWSWSR